MARSTRWKRFVSGCAGSVIPEYTLLLVVMVGGVALSSYVLGRHAKQLFTPLNRLEANAGTPNTSQPSGASRSPSRPVAKFASMAATERPVLDFGGWYVALATTFAALFFVRRHRRRQARPQVPDADGTEDLSASEQQCLFEKRQQILNILTRDVTTLSEGSVLVRHLMSHQPIAVQPATPIQEVAALMGGKGIHHLMVCNSRGSLLGVVSDRDFQYRQGTRAAAIMTRDPITVTPDTPIGPAITLMLNRHISCLPVVDNGNLAGVLTSTDLVMSLQCVLHSTRDVAVEELPSAEMSPN